jgi:hypothetical protein
MGYQTNEREVTNLMIGDYKTAQLLFQDRLREAEQRRAERELIRDAAEQNPRNGLLNRIKLMLNVQKPQAQGANDARHAHAL